MMREGRMWFLAFESSEVVYEQVCERLCKK
jgi:hypothetical protein